MPDESYGATSPVPVSSPIDAGSRAVVNATYRTTLIAGFAVPDVASAYALIVRRRVDVETVDVPHHDHRIFICSGSQVRRKAGLDDHIQRAAEQTYGCA
jgi:hypothetical protein